MKSKITFTLVLSMLLLGGSSFAAQSDMQDRQDNTKVNKRDRNKAEPTADQQTENRSDRDIAKDIRKAIVDDKSLSSYAHNVKVIVQNGSVTLKGPVRSEEEKKAVEAKATEVAGGRNVQNEITIEHEHNSK
jgi:hyperosmotically inducible periplasmic protein